MNKNIWKRHNVLHYINRGVNIDAYDKFDLTPLFVAVSYCETELTKILLEKGADVNKETGSGYSVLHAAVITGQLEVCSLLIQRGATFWTPIHKAIFYGDIETVKEGYPKIDTTEVVWTKAPAIFYAIGANHLDIIEWLVTFSPTIVSCKNLFGNTPLMCTCWTGSTEIASYLIAHNASPSETSDSNMTPLLWSALHGNISMIEFLLENGASLSESQSDGSTALIWASKNGHVRLLEWLLDKGCTLDHRTEDGNTPLLCAAEEGELGMVEFLLDHGSSIEESNGHVQTVLSLASSAEGSLDLVRYLMKYATHAETALERAMKEASPQAKCVISYYRIWPKLRYLFLGHMDKNSPLFILLPELINLISSFFQDF